MALSTLKFFSESLGMQTQVCVVIPQKNKSGEIGTSGSVSGTEYKCLYLLHGLSDDNTIWSRRTSIERYAEKYGICVVMPFGAKSFYTDMKYGEKYYTYISDELPRIIQEFFKVSSKREDNFIAGLSMGGYGAIKIGLKNCDKFCACAGLSSVADIERFAGNCKDVFVPVFGEDLRVPDSENLLKLVEKYTDNPQRPRIFMGVGTEDFLYEDNVRLKQKIESLNYDFTYRESHGVHSWDFWDEYIQYILEWMFK